MKNCIKAFAICCLVFVSLTSKAQQPQVFSPKGSFSLDLGVPAQINNAAFDRLMEGLFNGGADFRYNLFKGLTVGVGGKFSFFSINTFALNNLQIGGGYQIPAAYAYVGYEKFSTERVSLNAGIRGGYGLMMSFNDSCTVNNGGAYTTPAFFLEPQVEMVLLAERNSPHGFSLVLGYSFYFDEFDRDELCMNYIPNLVNENYEGITRFLSIGFGYRYYLGMN